MNIKYSAQMFCGTRYRLTSNSPVLRFLNFQFDNILYKNMSAQIDHSNPNMDTIEKSNKRQMVDENDEVVAKAPKIEGITKGAREKLKTKNFVIMLGYLGKDYFGMQRNPGIKTVEEDLLSALLKSDFITKAQFDDIRQLKFQRAARTDRGVSAVRQIVSLKLPDYVNKVEINQHLSPEIRVFGIKRVTKGFNSKNQCDARTYRYVIPTFSLAPEDPNFLQIDDEQELDVDKRLNQLSTIDGKPYNEFRLTADMLDKLNEILKLFEGTHNFHNFTSKIRPLDPSARRYVMKFRCVETFVANDTEFAVLEVKGQSFMLHQIRKMVSLAVGVARNIVTNDIVKDAFSLERIDIPIAPGLGLSLHHVHYRYYNRRYGKDGIHETLNWTECNEEVEKFYKDYILKSIVDTEVSEKTTLTWLASFLTPRRFAFKEPVASCENVP